MLFRGTSPAVLLAIFAFTLSTATNLSAVIYNSPFYGFENKVDLFIDLQRDFPNLIGFKEFAGNHSLSYAAEIITGVDSTLK